MIQFDLKVKEVNNDGVEVSETQIQPSFIEKDTKIEVEEPKKNYRQAQINFALPEEVKTNWKILCDKNHINLKQGITFAMEHLIQEIENDEVVLTIGGVMKKRK